MKNADDSFSYRMMAKLAGSSSPNFLQLLRDRKLNISDSAVSSLSRNLKLNRKEEEYFEIIVKFDHSKTSEEKDRYFQRILRTRHNSVSCELREEQYEYFSHWYMPAVRELVTCESYPGDPSWIACRLIPQVSESKIRKAVQLLESFGLIRRDNEKSRWVQTDHVISTPSEVLSVALARYTRDIFQLGTESVDRFESSERDLRGITIGIPESAFPELKERMEAFWRELMAFGRAQGKVDRVYQINLQLFPLSGKRIDK